MIVEAAVLNRPASSVIGGDTGEDCDSGVEAISFGTLGAVDESSLLLLSATCEYPNGSTSVLAFDKDVCIVSCNFMASASCSVDAP
jgi:hypothetical protein